MEKEKVIKQSHKYIRTNYNKCKINGAKKYYTGRSQIGCHIKEGISEAGYLS